MSGSRRAWWLLAAATAVVIAATLLARGGQRTATLDDRVREVASGLRCPVCQNLSVADSPSRLAGEMRSEIAEQLQAGRTPEEVHAFFVQRYGEWVLLSPPREGLNLVPWLVPIVGVMIGIGVWAYVLRRRAGGGAEHVSDADHDRVARELASFEEPA